MAGKNVCSSSDYSSYQQDTRIPCKYGAKCYQKNASHHSKYKHPSKRSSDDELPGSADKKYKIDGHSWGKTESADKEPEIDMHNKTEMVTLDQSSRNVTADIPSSSTKGVSGDIDNRISSETSESTGITQASQLKDSEDVGNNAPKNYKDELEESPPSPENVRENIKQKFLMEMPDDFFLFWSFCEHLSSKSPADALSTVGLKLVGPFDILSGVIEKGKPYSKSQYLRHWRYYYDPPEFQTVIKGDDKRQFHMGYFRDDPKELPCFVASNCADEDCIIKPMAPNIFGALNLYLDEFKRKANPFQKMKVSPIQNSLQEWAKNHKISLEQNSLEMKARFQKTVCKTFHKAGMVVPYNKKTELGYRPLVESERNLKRLLGNVVSAKTTEERDKFLGKLQEVITAANIATDECDFGTGLELALAMFCFGGDVFHNIIRQLAVTAYDLLGRNEFALILEAHLEDRKKGTDLSIVKK